MLRLDGREQRAKNKEVMTNVLLSGEPIDKMSGLLDTFRNLQVLPVN
jgi:hypothetical protein